MIRFVIQKRIRDSMSGAEYSAMYTIDADVPALQQALTSGGFDIDSYEVNSLIGVEILPQPNPGESLS